MEPVAHPSGSGWLRFPFLVLLVVFVALATPRPVTAQWTFSPAGYLYPRPGGALQTSVDHVTLLADDAERYGLQRSGVYARDGRIRRFVSLVDEWVPERRKLVFEFETESRDGVSYRFTGEFQNSHVYEEYVKDPSEVVASGELSVYESGKLERRAPVQWTYSPKPRDVKSDVNVPYPSGRTDLMIAAASGDLDRVRALLAQGAKVNLLSRYGDTALINAVGLELRSVELAQVLIAAGADVNLAGHGSTALIAAAGKGDTALLQLLLAAGANVNAADEYGLTALICEVQEMGVREGSRESVEALLRAGADVNAKDRNGRTALSIARANHDDETVAILLQAGAKE
jgi:hypothetical protein